MRLEKLMIDLLFVILLVEPWSIIYCSVYRSLSSGERKIFQFVTFI